MEENMEKKESKAIGCLKTGLIIIGAFFAITILIGIIATIFSDDESDKPKTEEAVTDTIPKVESQEILDSELTKNLKSSLEGLNKPFERKVASTKDEIIVWLALFNVYGQHASAGLESENEEDVKLARQLKEKVGVLQKVEFPKLRKEYGDILYNIGWENDMYVVISDKDNSVITFTYRGFATNKNIKEFQESLYEMLTLLRFKQVRYTWYKGQDDYTYFDMKPPKDTELITITKK
jgi:hypothetical protein